MARWIRGRTRGWQNYEIWLDGYPVEYPLYADEAEGIVVVACATDAGQPFNPDWEDSEPDDPDTEVRSGHVELIHTLMYDED